LHNKTSLDNYFSLSPKDQRIAEVNEIPADRLLGYTHALLADNLKFFTGPYEKVGGSITFQIGTSPGYASAYALDTLEPNHVITINQFFIIELSANIQAFCKYAVHGIRSGEILEWLESEGIVPGESGFLYEGLDGKYASDSLLSRVLLWLFLHEAAHLLQFHGLVRYGGPHIPRMGPIEMDASNSTSCSGPEAEIHQVTELAADYEAIARLSIKLKLSKEYGFALGHHKEPFLTLGDIWLTFVSIFLIFIKFHEPVGAVFTGEIIGHHPHPAIRLRQNFRTFLRFMIDDLKSDTGPQYNADVIEKVLNNSLKVVLAFWSERYGHSKMIENFFEVLSADTNEALVNFYTVLVPCWDEARPKIAKNYPEMGYLMVWDKQARRLSGNLNNDPA
jgi:hypothetical protein